MVLAQYYNFARLGHDGYRDVMQTLQLNAQTLAARIKATGDFEIVGGEHDEQLPLVAFKLTGERDYDEFDVAAQLAAVRGWMVPAYTLPPKAEHVKIMRVLVKESLGHSLAMVLGADIASACKTLDAKGAMHESERKRVKSNTGF
jgi:glutamate decarboxylase